jgi:hypothetical protein
MGYLVCLPLNARESPRGKGEPTEGVLPNGVVSLKKGERSAFYPRFTQGSLRCNRMLKRASGSKNAGMLSPQGLGIKTWSRRPRVCGGAVVMCRGR